MSTSNDGSSRDAGARRAKPEKPKINEPARFHVAVEEIRPEHCEWCMHLTDRTVRATHVVKVTTWISWRGAVAEFTNVCEQHAEEIAKAARAALAAAEGGAE